MNTTASFGGDRTEHAIPRRRRPLIAVVGCGMIAASASAGAAFLPAIPDPVASLGRDHPLAGQVVQLRTRSLIEPGRLVEMAIANRFVLLGEKHDNPDHHLLQAWVIDAMVMSGRKPAIAMEMLDSDQTRALAEYRNSLSANAAGLGAAVGWQQRGWPEWSLYAPIAEVAFRANLPIVPADLTRSQRRSVGRGGKEALDSAVKSRIRLAPFYDVQQSASLAQELTESHCGHLPEGKLQHMMDVQWARDANMAATLIEAASLDGVAGAVLIAGTGHVRADRGVPWHLQRMADIPRIMTLAFVEVEDARMNVADYALDGRFDVVWFTARVDDDDPCAKFRNSLQRIRKP